MLIIPICFADAAWVSNLFRAAPTLFRRAAAAFSRLRPGRECDPYARTHDERIRRLSRKAGPLPLVDLESRCPKQ